MGGVFGFDKVDKMRGEKRLNWASLERRFFDEERENASGKQIATGGEHMRE